MPSADFPSWTDIGKRLLLVGMSLPAALGAVGQFYEKLKFDELLTRLVVGYRQVSAAFWSSLPLRLPFDHLTLSFAALVLAPAVAFLIFTGGRGRVEPWTPSRYLLGKWVVVTLLALAGLAWLFLTPIVATVIALMFLGLLAMGGVLLWLDVKYAREVRRGNWFPETMFEIWLIWLVPLGLIALSIAGVAVVFLMPAAASPGDLGWSIVGLIAAFAVILWAVMRGFRGPAYVLAIMTVILAINWVATGPVATIDAWLTSINV